MSTVRGDAHAHATRVSCEKTHNQSPFSRARTSVDRPRVAKPSPMNCPLLVVIPVTTAVYTRGHEPRCTVDSIDSRSQVPDSITLRNRDLSITRPSASTITQSSVTNRPIAAGSLLTTACVNSRSNVPTTPLARIPPRACAPQDVSLKPTGCPDSKISQPAISVPTWAALISANFLRGQLSGRFGASRVEGHRRECGPPRTWTTCICGRVRRPTVCYGR